MSKPTPKEIADVLAAFEPKRRPKFGHLVDWHDLIAGLRQKGASFAAITEILRQRGVRTSREQLRHFFHETLGEKNLLPSTRRKQTAVKPEKPTPVGPIPTQTSPQPTNPPPKRGPRIAQIELIQENEP